MSDWTTTTLGEIGQIYDGPHATPTRQAVGPYFLNIASLSSGRLDLTLSDHVSTEDFARWTRRVTPRTDDLLFSYETRLGEAALMPADIEACLGRRMALIRPKRDRVDPRFLLYLYLSPQFQSTIEQNTIHGATVNRIPLNRMGTWEVSLPPVPEQQAIAEALGALDDKIAANTALAAAADSLLAIEFCARLDRVAAREAPLREVASVILGGTPSRARSEYWTDGTIPWLSSGAVNATRIIEPSEFITQDALVNSAAKMMPAGATLLAITGATLGQIARLEIPASGNQSIVGVWSDDGPFNTWLYFAIQARRDALLARATGAAQQHVSKADVEQLGVPIPVRVAVDEFAALAGPLLELATSAARENRTLAATRDALLPQLISGKLRVRDAENIASEAGA